MKPFRITIHCTSTENGKPIPAVTINEWDRQRGLTKIGYHFVIQPSGYIEQGRGLEETGRHCDGEDAGNIGIILAGTDRFTLAQLESLRELVNEICVEYEIAVEDVFAFAQFGVAQRAGITEPNMDIFKLRRFFESGKPRHVARYFYVDGREDLH